MKGLRLEFYKCRRRKIFLLYVGVLIFQFLWVGMSLKDMDATELVSGWQWLLYTLSLTDCFILPLAVATLASRNVEIEHKGGTLKLLETLTTPKKLYRAKLLWGAVMLAVLVLVRSGAFIVLGYWENFGGAMPWQMLGRFTLISWLVSMMLYLLQLGLSLRYANQAIAIIVGIAGGFLGLMSLFFPGTLRLLLPWSYYGALASSGMSWDAATSTVNYFWLSPNTRDLVLLFAWMLVFYVVGRTLFVRKEV
ncbi:MAG: ABC transporter permease [Peptococcaceae bacterium]|nr:ABC transporter permease [Peptococcaceae bacterium]